MGIEVDRGVAMVGIESTQVQNERVADESVDVNVFEEPTALDGVDGRIHVCRDVIRDGEAAGVRVRLAVVDDDLDRNVTKIRVPSIGDDVPEKRVDGIQGKRS
jgi:hypothetical protein